MFLSNLWLITTNDGALNLIEKSLFVIFIAQKAS